MASSSLTEFCRNPFHFRSIWWIRSTSFQNPIFSTLTVQFINDFHHHLPPECFSFPRTHVYNHLKVTSNSRKALLSLKSSLPRRASFQENLVRIRKWNLLKLQCFICHPFLSELQQFLTHCSYMPWKFRMWWWWEHSQPPTTTRERGRGGVNLIQTYWSEGKTAFLLKGRKDVDRGTFIDMVYFAAAVLSFHFILETASVWCSG